MRDAGTARRTSAVAWPLAFVVVAIVACSLLSATSTEVSVWKDFHRDVAVRDSYRLDEVADIRFSDSSPYAIWLGSDLFVWRSVRSGTLPLWDPSQAGGYSLLGNVQNGVMHPVRWVTAAVSREFAPSFLIVIELTLLALGMQLMLRRVFDLEPEAAACGAVVLALCGFTMSVVQFSGALLPLVHVPWIIWSWYGWSSSREGRYAFAMIVVVALLMISGHPLLIGTSVLSVAATIIWLAIAERRIRDIAWAALFSGFALLLSAVVVIPSFLGARDAWSYKLHSPAGLAYQAIGETQFWDSLSAIVIWESYEWDKLDGGRIAYYLGPIVLLFALIGLARAAASRRSAVVLLLASAGLFLSTPPDLLVPIVRATTLAYFKPWYLMFPLAVGLAAATALAADLLLLKISSRGKPVAAVLILVAIVFSLRPAILAGLAPSKLRIVNLPLLERLNADPEAFRIVALRGQTHLPNSGAITGLEDVRFSSPLLPGRYREWFRIVAPEAIGDSFPTAILPDGVDSRLYGAFNVKYVLRSRLPGDGVQTFLRREGDKPPRTYAIDAVPDSATHPELLALPSVTLYENRNGYHARAHFASSAVVVRPGVSAAIRAMRDPANAGAEVLEAGDRIAQEALGEMTRVSAGDAVAVRYPSTRRVEIATRSEGPRILVLHDAWDPGWRVRIDGSPVDAFPVSLISRGVVVPPGAHNVVMTFFPRGFLGGAAVSLIAALATAILVGRMASPRGDALQ